MSTNLNTVFCTICCKKKNESSELIPAQQRYLSERIASVRELAEKEEMKFYILSGKLGFIHSSELIPYYDQRLLLDKAEVMTSTVVAQLKKLELNKVVFYGRLRHQFPAWIPYYDVIEKACAAAGVELEIRQFT